MLNEISARAIAAVQARKSGQEGASAVEYGLILGLIAVAIIVALGLIGTDLTALFNDAASALPGGT